MALYYNAMRRIPEETFLQIMPFANWDIENEVCKEDWRSHALLACKMIKDAE